MGALAEVLAPGDPDIGDLSTCPAEAQELTERIRSTTREVCLLLLEAHRRRVWVPLGYRSWTEYVHNELGLSRSRSYELLDQARVVRVIQTEAGINEFPNISTYAAGQLRPHLAEITVEIRARTANLPERQAVEVVQDIIRDVRARVAPPRSRGAERSDRVDVRRLEDAIQRLANMPPARVVAAGIPETEIHRLAQLRSARRRLMDFASHSARG